MVLSGLTIWHLGLIPVCGCGVALVLYLTFRISPPGQPPQYIIELEEKAILGGRMSMIAESAAKELSQEPPEPPSVDDIAEKPIFRETINNEVMDAFNEYKRACVVKGSPPNGLTAWLRTFDPDLARRLNAEE